MIDIRTIEANDIELQHVLDDAFDLGMKMIALAFSVPASLILPEKCFVIDTEDNPHSGQYTGRSNEYQPYRACAAQEVGSEGEAQLGAQTQLRV